MEYKIYSNEQIIADRQLLGDAAKAANISVESIVLGSTGSGGVIVKNEFSRKYWNPLTNNDDAFSLAIKLGIGISLPDKKFPNVRRAFLGQMNYFSVMDDDHEAAVRRAVTMAAASMITI